MPTRATDQTALEVITDALVKFGAERDQITGEATFEQLDIDSLDLAELAQVIEEQFGVLLAASDVKQVKTIDDLTALILERA